MLRASTCRSLLLIDEFGKGTQPEDGVSLLAASIRQLVSRGQDCPRTVRDFPTVNRMVDIRLSPRFVREAF
jgi:hypothetical protein